MSSLNSQDGGYETARLSSSERDRLARADRGATALRYLTRRGLDDIAVILGLTREMCSAECGAEAVRAGYCDSTECRTQRRVAARGPQ